ncbi:TonB-dependent siderophore receptor [Campylobacter sp. FMV-PI01]|uniref:TonB-dependent siderophore receptor n=1 Tax=Campylobacter portucalensis TaxID=2608384 RepID=A0A6L5WG31_9BACT|nr:TonB-dependent siderophore receptor [Campylobacter portucalensis]MSN95974.1 TonB-dependent siderophore receptor [Campylobacter portucalensis]
MNKILPLTIAVSIPFMSQINSKELEKIQVKTYIMQEMSKSYTAPFTSTATGLELSIKQTPQSISIISNKLIKDQNLHNISQAMSYANGISKNANIGGVSRSRFYSRGFEIDNIQEDGLFSLAFASPAIDLSTGFLPLYSAKELTDLIFYDRVEILRGLATLTQSNSNPSGTINLRRKRPDAKFGANLSLEAGSYDKYLGSFDINGKLSNNSRLRAIGSLSKLGSFIDKENGDRHSLGLMYETDFTRNKILNLGIIYQKTKNSPNIYGLSTHHNNKEIKFDKSKYFGSLWDRESFKKVNIFGDLEYFLNDDWSLLVAFNYTKSKMDMKFGQFWNNANGWGMRQKFQSKSDEINVKISLDGKYTLFNQNHDFFINTQFSKDKISGSDIITPYIKGIDIFKFNKNYLNEPNWHNDNNYGKYNLEIKQKSITAGSRINFSDNLHLLFGARFSDIEYKNRSKNLMNRNLFSGMKIPQPFTKNNSSNLSEYKITPYIGINYDFLEHFSLYASYAEIFKPQLNKKSNDSFVKPMIGYNLEAGIKGEFFDRQLNTSLSIFQTKRKHQAIPEVNNKPINGAIMSVPTGSWLDDGSIGTRGVELEISGQMSQNLEGFIGYTYNKSKYLANYYTGPSQVSQNKNELANVFLPKHILKFYLSYQIPDFKKLTIGFGGRYQSKTLSYYKKPLASSPQGAYVLFDSNINYKFNQNFEANLAIKNITNKRYFVNSMTRMASRLNFYGEPRNFTLSLNYKF